MSNWRRGSWVTTWIVVSALSASASAQSKGARAISAADMKPYLAFLGSKEFRGRSAPSAELDIASKDIAVEAARIGLTPLMPGGSYFQDVPVEATTISAARSFLRVTGPAGELRLTFPQAFTSNVRMPGDWSAAGGLVFVGTALDGSEAKWDEATAGDLRGRFAVLLETPPPGGTTIGPRASRSRQPERASCGRRVPLGRFRSSAAPGKPFWRRRASTSMSQSGCASSMSTRSTRRRVRPPVRRLQPRRRPPRRRRSTPPRSATKPAQPYWACRQTISAACSTPPLRVNRCLPGRWMA